MRVRALLKSNNTWLLLRSRMGPLCVTFTPLGIATTSMVNKRGHEASSEHIRKGKRSTQMYTHTHTHTHIWVPWWLVSCYTFSCMLSHKWVLGSIYTY
jgi:hypothetical protein